MPLVPFLTRLFPWFKWTLYSLLGVNVALFFAEKTLVEGLDSLAWVALLLLFEWESRQIGQAGAACWKRQAIFGGRILAYGIVLGTAFGYSLPAFRATQGALDLWNAWTWIAVVLLLEYDVQVPDGHGRVAWAMRNGAKILLYGALLAYALLWCLSGRWLNGYDALLWILCFFTVETNLLETLEKTAGGRSDRSPVTTVGTGQ